MMPSLDGGVQSFVLGGAFAIALELTTHILIHYTVPGATLAANLAQSLAPVMDGLSLTTIFGDAAAGSGVEAASSLAGECIAGGFCPIHNPIVGEPLISKTSAPAAALPVPSGLEGLPVLE